MKALIRKDMVWAIVFLLAGLPLHLWILSSWDFEEVFILPIFSFLPDCLFFWMIFSLVLGIFAPLREELTRTEEFLRHRPVSPLRIFCVKMGLCFFVILCWILTPFGVVILTSGIGNVNASLADWSRIWTFLGMGTISFTVFMAAYFACSLRLPWFKRLIAGFAALVGCFLPFYMMAQHAGREWTFELPLFVTYNLCVIAVLLYGSYLNFLQAHDRDRPLEGKGFCFSGMVLVVSMILFISLALTSLQHWVLDTRLAWTYPCVRKTQSGDFRLFKTLEMKNINRGAKCCPMTDKHEIDEENLDNDECAPDRKEPGRFINTAYWQDEGKHSPLGSPFYFCCVGERWQALQSNRGPVKVYYKPSEGLIYVYKPSADHPGSKLTLTTRGKGPENMSFSDRGVHYPFKKDFRYFESILSKVDGKTWIGEPGDKEVWVLDLTDPDLPMERIPIPNDDKFCKWISVASDGYQSGVLGEKQIHALKDSKLVPLDVKASDFIKNRLTRDYSYHFPEADPIRPTVEVKNAQGEVIFSHRYGLYTGKEKAYGMCLYAGSLFRVPLFQCYSFFGGHEARASFFNSAVIDPLLASGKRLWLVAGNLLLALGMTFWIFRRLGRLGIANHRRTFWLVATLLGGFPIFLACCFLETRRVYRKSPVLSPREAPPLLIHSP